MDSYLHKLVDAFKTNEVLNDKKGTNAFKYITKINIEECKNEYNNIIDEIVDEFIVNYNGDILHQLKNSINDDFKKMYLYTMLFCIKSNVSGNTWQELVFIIGVIWKMPPRGRPICERYASILVLSIAEQLITKEKISLSIFMYIYLC